MFCPCNAVFWSRSAPRVSIARVITNSCSTSNKLGRCFSYLSAIFTSSCHRFRGARRQLVGPFFVLSLVGVGQISV